MERLTIKSEQYESHYVLKCNCTIGVDGKVDSEDGCIEYCELHDGDCEDCKIQEAFDRLAAYEDTGLTPEEVEALKADNDRLHRLIDELEAVFVDKPEEHNNDNNNKVHCRDCDYLNMDSGKPYCCHPHMSTSGFDDWCDHGRSKCNESRTMV